MTSFRSTRTLTSQDASRRWDALFELFERGGPLVVHVHGVAGIGKSSLLEAFGARARSRGARVVRIDCRAVAPTAQAFLAELSEALGEPLATMEDAAQRLSSFGENVVIALDTTKRIGCGHVDPQVFVPSLPVNTRMATAGRNPPSSAWRTAPGWQGLFRSLTLEPLSESIRCRTSYGPAFHRRSHDGSPCHARSPACLGMAASIVLSDPERAIEETGLHQVIDELSRAPTLRRSGCDYAARAGSELGGPLCDRTAAPCAPSRRLPRDTMERLAALPFVELGREGLFIHDAVRSAVATSLAARDPDSHREYRRAAWTYLRDRSRPVYAADMWRHTADLLFLLENPVLREGFFPSGPHPLAVEPATPDDETAVQRIVATQAAPQLDAIMAWWRHQPEAFHVVMIRTGASAGFT